MGGWNHSIEATAFHPEIISHAVWLYHQFTLSFRDVEDLLAEHGILVSYEAIQYWCLKFGPAWARSLRRKQGRFGDIWPVQNTVGQGWCCGPHGRAYGSRART